MYRLVLFSALAVVLPAAAQDVPTGLTLASGYASGFQGGAVHGEARLRFAGAGLGLEPAVSWTGGLPYEAVVDPGHCVGGPCGPSRIEGERVAAVGVALAYRTAAKALPLGLEAHLGTFGQTVLPLWSQRGYRVGVEAGAAVPLGQVRLGVDLQVARFTGGLSGAARTSATPLLRMALGR